MKKQKLWMLGALVATCALLAIGVSACGSSSSTAAEQSSASTESEGNSTGSEDSSAGSEGGSGSVGSSLTDTGLKFIYVGTVPTTDATESRIVAGTEAADEVYGSETQYRSPEKNCEAAESRRIFENALAEHPDGILAADCEPAALNAPIKALSDAGIPVVLVNAGLGETQKTGALTYVGNDEYATGKLGGEMLGEEGATHALLVTAQAGIPLVDLRNEGFEAGFPGEVTQAAIPITELGDVTKVRNVTEAEIQKDPSIDAVFGVGSGVSSPVLAARSRLGARSEEIHWATIDLGEPVLKAIENGEMEFGLDQQPWLQGYLGVQQLVLNAKYGFRAGSDIVATGPVVVNKENVQEINELSKENIR